MLSKLLTGQANLYKKNIIFIYTQLNKVQMPSSCENGIQTIVYVFFFSLLFLCVPLWHLPLEVIK